MTNEEIRAMSLVVAPHFGLWAPGPCKGTSRMDGICEICGSKLFDRPPRLDSFSALALEGKRKRHEIPCPDLTQPEWFARLLKEIHRRRYEVWFTPLGTEIHCIIWTPSNRADGLADIFELALLEAAYQLVQREASK